jgi:hypothetical protein
MRCPRRSEYHTGFTKLESIHITVSRASRVDLTASTFDQVKYSVLFMFYIAISAIYYRLWGADIGFNCRDHTWVSKTSQK